MEIWQTEKLGEKSGDIMGKKLSDKRITMASTHRHKHCRLPPIIRGRRKGSNNL